MRFRVRNQSGARPFIPYAVYDANAGGGGAHNLTTMETVLKDMGGTVKQVSEDLKKISATYMTEINNLGDATRETKAAADKALAESTDIKAQLAAIEQTVARLRQGGGADAAPKTVGQAVAESDEYKAWRKAKNTSRVTIAVKNLITSATTDADGSAGALVAVDRRPGILGIPQRRMTVRDLLAPGRTASNMVEYLRETGFTNNAGIQATEGASKNESTLKFGLVQAPVVTVAHFMRASKQILDDAPMLQSFIDMRLRYGLMLEEERQLLQGIKADGELDGLIPNATAYSASFLPALPTIIDTIRLAMLQAALAEWPATGIVLHPIQWAEIELTKDEEGRYILANPQSLIGPTLWGLPVVATQSMPATKFLVGAFIPAAQLFDREDANVQVSTEDADNFTKNLVTIRAEQREVLAIYRPEALIYGDLGENS